jgi:hypothetical protein
MRKAALPSPEGRRFVVSGFYRKPLGWLVIEGR